MITMWCQYQQQVYHIMKKCHVVPPFDYLDQTNTQNPGDYNSVTVAILSQNHRDIDITESVLASIKVRIAVPRGFPNNDIIGIPLDKCSTAIFFSIGSIIYY